MDSFDLLRGSIAALHVDNVLHLAKSTFTDMSVVRKKVSTSEEQNQVKLILESAEVDPDKIMPWFQRALRASVIKGGGELLIAYASMAAVQHQKVLVVETQNEYLLSLVDDSAFFA